MSCFFLSLSQQKRKRTSAGAAEAASSSADADVDVASAFLQRARQSHSTHDLENEPAAGEEDEGEEQH